MQKPEAAEGRRSASDSEGLQSGFSLDRMREIEQERRFCKEKEISGHHRRQVSHLLQRWLWGPYSKHGALKVSVPRGQGWPSWDLKENANVKDRMEIKGMKTGCVHR